MDRAELERIARERYGVEIDWGDSGTAPPPGAPQAPEPQGGGTALATNEEPEERPERMDPAELERIARERYGVEIDWAPGDIASRPIQETHPSLVNRRLEGDILRTDERHWIKNRLVPYGPEKVIEYLKGRGFEATTRPGGGYALREPGGKWHVLDEDRFTLRDIGDLAKEATEIAAWSGAGRAAAPIARGLGLFGRIGAQGAAAGAATGGTELAYQPSGMPASERLEHAGKAAALGGALEGGMVAGGALLRRGRDILRGSVHRGPKPGSEEAGRELLGQSATRGAGAMRDYVPSPASRAAVMEDFARLSGRAPEPPPRRSVHDLGPYTGPRAGQDLSRVEREASRGLFPPKESKPEIRSAPEPTGPKTYPPPSERFHRPGQVDVPEPRQKPISELTEGEAAQKLQENQQAVMRLFGKSGEVPKGARQQAERLADEIEELQTHLKTVRGTQGPPEGRILPREEPRPQAPEEGRILPREEPRPQAKPTPDIEPPKPSRKGIISPAQRARRNQGQYPDQLGSAGKQVDDVIEAHADGNKKFRISWTSPKGEQKTRLVRHRPLVMSLDTMERTAKTGRLEAFDVDELRDLARDWKLPNADSAEPAELARMLREGGVEVPFKGKGRRVNPESFGGRHLWDVENSKWITVKLDDVTGVEGLRGRWRPGGGEPPAAGPAPEPKPKPPTPQAPERPILGPEPPRAEVPPEKPPATAPRGPEVQEFAEPPKDTVDFAREVTRIADSMEQGERGVFGSNKAFISEIWERFKKTPQGRGMTKRQFQEQIVRAHNQDSLTLARADLLQAMDPRLVEASETPYLNATFHFVRKGSFNPSQPTTAASTPAPPTPEVKAAVKAAPERMAKEATPKPKPKAKAKAKAKPKAKAEAKAKAKAAPEPEGELKDHPIREMPVEEVGVDPARLQFKGGVNKAGIIEGEALQGQRYERLGTAPLVVWEDKAGKKWVVNGHHRLEFARRVGEETVPVQVIREADGVTVDGAKAIGAEINIRDGTGSIEDYANFFRFSGIPKAHAESRGLLARGKGQDAWVLGQSAGDDLYALWLNGKISTPKAVAIAKSAPGDATLQYQGTTFALSKEKPSADQLEGYVQLLKRQRASGPEKRFVQQDILGGVDPTADATAKKLSSAAASIQSELREKIRAVDYTLRTGKRIQAAKELGVDVADPDRSRKLLEELKRELEEWDSWYLKPHLVQKARARAGFTQSEFTLPPAEERPILGSEPPESPPPDQSGQMTFFRPPQNPAEEWRPSMRAPQPGGVFRGGGGPLQSPRGAPRGSGRRAEVLSQVKREVRKAGLRWKELPQERRKKILEDAVILANTAQWTTGARIPGIGGLVRSAAAGIIARRRAGRFLSRLTGRGSKSWASKLSREKGAPKELKILSREPSGSPRARAAIGVLLKDQAARRWLEDHTRE